MKSSVRFPKPPVKLYGNQSMCTACGLMFRVVSTFESHRVGGWGDRRCLTPAQLLEKGFTQDSKGIWRGPAGKVLHWRAA